MAADFERATRLQLRFDSPQGQLSVENLWDLPLTSNNEKRANLDDIAIALDRKLKDTATTSFVKKTVSPADTTRLKFDVVLHIITVRQAEAEAETQKKLNADKKQQLLAILAQKENEALAGKSVEELRALIDTL
jgi:predicted RNA-binding Zn ribbon-like protein